MSSLEELILWIALTVLGAGLYIAVPVQPIWGIVLCTIGLAGIAYAGRQYLRPVLEQALKAIREIRKGRHEIPIEKPRLAPQAPPVEIPALLIPEGSVLNALSGLPSDPEAEQAAEHLIETGASRDAMALFTREQFKRFDGVYNLDKATGLLTLKPQIDTRSREADALLLIVYGYKMLKGRSDVPVGTANRSLRDSGYTRNLTVMQIATMMFDQNLDADAVAREYVAVGYLRKHGLARGGVFSLTDEGISKAEALIDDIYPRLD